VERRGHKRKLCICSVREGQHDRKARVITSTSNPRVKALLALKEARERRRQGLCLIEGRDEIAHAFRGGLHIQTLFYTDTDKIPSREDRGLLEEMRTAGVEFAELSPRVLTRLSYREHPDSILALASCPAASLADFAERLDHAAIPPTMRATDSPNTRSNQAALPPAMRAANTHDTRSDQAALPSGKNTIQAADTPGTQSNQAALPSGRLLALLDGVEKPGNIGAALRSLDAAGFDGLIACACPSDLANPNIIRAGKGSVFTLPVAECDPEEALAWLRERGYRVFALHPEGADIYFNYEFYTRHGEPENMAFVFGSEHRGLSPFWLERAHLRITIPMLGKVNSLNVAQAVTLLAYEVLRQRCAAALKVEGDMKREGYEARF